MCNVVKLSPIKIFSIRANAETYLMRLPRAERSGLVSCIKNLLRNRSLSSAVTRMDVRMVTEKGRKILAHGLKFCRRFACVLGVHGGRVVLYAILDVPRLTRTSKEQPCRIFQELHDEQLHIECRIVPRRGFGEFAETTLVFIWSHMTGGKKIPSDAKMLPLAA